MSLLSFFDSSSRCHVLVCSMLLWHFLVILTFWGADKKCYLFSWSWGSNKSYFREGGEQAHTFIDLGSAAKKTEENGEIIALLLGINGA